MARRLENGTIITGRRGALALAGAAAAVTGWTLLRRPSPQDFEAAYARPLTPPKAPLNVFHLGHSLVGRDMPAMLGQLAGPGHTHASQLGWGTPLRAHWQGSLEIAGFEAENAHPAYRDATEALQGGTYDAFVATEMVELRDAIRFHASGEHLHLWADLARRGNPAIRVYLYETWHPTDTPEGWLERLDADLARHWEAEVLFDAIARDPAHRPIHVIPAGQVMAQLVRAVEAQGGVDNLADRHDLFAILPDGSRDPVHLGDLGAYLVALVHYAVLYHRSPVGLPRELARADGTRASPPGPAAARLMQETVWQVVTSYPKTGVAA